MIKINNVFKYYKGLEHQVDAIDYLQDNIPAHVLEEFAKRWRQSAPSIDWNNPKSKVSKYFTVGEVTNNDSRRIPQSDSIKANIIELAKELDVVREQWGGPIRVTSWYRPAAINRAVGGASRSQHITGRAVDISPIGKDIYKFQSWLDKSAWSDKALGYGAKRGFVHLDLRAGRIRWNY